MSQQNNNGQHLEQEEDQHLPDDEDDIPDGLVEAFFEEIENIPLESKLEYTEALLNAPDILETESNPIVFLRYANYDATRAAKALCDYWKRRIEIFGKDKAFEPMTLQGACSDIVQSIVNMPTAYRLLTNDDCGRTVFCCDRTNINLSDFDDQVVFVKYLWYVYHTHIQNNVPAQKTGVVLIAINRSTNHFKRSVLRYLWRNYLPLKFYCCHFCFSSVLSRIVIPTIKLFLKEVDRKRIELHLSLKSPTTLGELEEFGLHAKNLPTSLGGMYKEKPSWVIQCEQMTNGPKSNRRGPQGIRWSAY